MYFLAQLWEMSVKRSRTVLLLDCVLYADTTMEFPEMEAHIAKLDDLLYRERGIHITTLRHPHGFEWLMFDVPQQQKRASTQSMGISFSIISSRSALESFPPDTEIE